MRLKLLIFLCTFSFSSAFGQINMSDSSAQIIGYWSIGDKQTYDISYERYKVTNQDTSSRMIMKYEVDITIKDSTENSYTIEWFYKNYDIDFENEMVKEILKAAEDISVLIKTDEFGAVEEVLNWEEVSAYMANAITPLINELKNIPGAEQIIEQSMAMYKDKAAIEANAIKDAMQFYTFHGAAYSLNEELTGQIQVANNFGGEPFDVDVSLVLDELNEEDDNLVIRMFQAVDSEKLTEATYEYLAKTGTFGNDIPNFDELPPLTNHIWTASRIHGSTGWTTYSVETKEVNSADTTQVEERIIQIR